MINMVLFDTICMTIGLPWNGFTIYAKLWHKSQIPPSFTLKMMLNRFTHDESQEVWHCIKSIVYIAPNKSLALNYAYKKTN